MQLLLSACKEKNLFAIQAVLALPFIDVNAADENGYTALLWACENGHADIVKLLLDHPRIDVDLSLVYVGKPLAVASKNKHLEVIKLLLGHPKINAQVNNNDVASALHFAIVEEKCLEVINILLSRDEIAPYTILLWACQLGSSASLTYLLTLPSIDVNARDATDGNTGLFSACQEERLDVVILLLKQPNIDVNVRNKYGKTALHWVCEHGHFQIAQLLLDTHGIRVNILNNDDDTILHWACSQKKFFHIVSFLLKHPKIDVNAKNKNGDTALHLACRQGHLDIVKFLLKQSKIDVNAKNKNGDTALHLACHQGHLDIVKLLLEDSQIDMNAKNKNDRTPLYLACKEQRSNIILILLPAICQRDSFLFNAVLKFNQDDNLEELNVFNNHPSFEGVNSSLNKTIVLNAGTHFPVNITKDALKNGLLEMLNHFKDDFFALTVFLSDGFLKLPETKMNDNARRFFKMIMQLPQELQMVICMRLIGCARNIIRSTDSEPAFKHLAKHLAPPPLPGSTMVSIIA
jgi:ankyrin repeat protein